MPSPFEPSTGCVPALPVELAVLQRIKVAVEQAAVPLSSGEFIPAMQGFKATVTNAPRPIIPPQAPLGAAAVEQPATENLSAIPALPNPAGGPSINPIGSLGPLDMDGPNVDGNHGAGIKKVRA